VIARRELRISQLVLDIPLPGSRSEGERSSIPKISGVLASSIGWISNAFQKLHGNSIPKAKDYCSKLLRSIELERVGDMHFAEQDDEQALTKYDFSLTLESSAFAKNYLDMAVINVKIGDCWFGMDQYEQAMEEYAFANLRYKQVFREYNTTAANSLCKSAAVLLKDQKFDDALS
jgi:tetratricopeptide (TPR) repeat protein